MKRIFASIIVIMLFLTACSSESEILPIKESLEWNMRLNQIFEIENAQDFVYAMCDYIGEKCEYGMNMSVLSACERAFYITQLLEMEVNNGGFSQFFFNSAGDYANEVPIVFESMGAVKTAEICRDANSIYGDSVPVDWEERQAILLDLEDEFDTYLSRCDDAFFAYEEDLYILIRDFVLNHRHAFS